MSKRNINRALTLLVVFAVICTLFCSCRTIEDKITNSENYDIQKLSGTALDYSQVCNWVKFENNPNKKVDLLYIYPTISIFSTNETGLAVLDDEYRNKAMQIYNAQGSAFAEYTNVYVPLYRQVCMDKVVKLIFEDNLIGFTKDSLARTDIYAALDYYFINVNNSRPFILAGHSQGSALCLIALQEYFKVHPEYLKRMVACYAPGFGFDYKWISENPHLKFATRETDTGCIVCWNTEGPGANMSNYCIGKNNPYCINPINWKTDGTYASEKENLGSLIDGKIVKNYSDAQVDVNRGALISTKCNDYIPEKLAAVFGDKCLHSYDYAFFYENIKANGKSRIDAFFSK